MIEPALLQHHTLALVKYRPASIQTVSRLSREMQAQVPDAVSFVMPLLCCCGACVQLLDTAGMHNRVQTAMQQRGVPAVTTHETSPADTLRWGASFLAQNSLIEVQQTDVLATQCEALQLLQRH